MPKDIRVLIIENDPYARDMIAMLLTRDWRTRIVGELGANSKATLINLLSQPSARIDVIIVDTEEPGNPDWPVEIAQFCNNRSAAQRSTLLYTCTQPDARMLTRLQNERFGGYLVKGEILYSIAAAVSAAYFGKVVITPGVQGLINFSNHSKRTLVLNGAQPVAKFTHREADLVRLGILFNLPQRDIADELVVSTDFVAEVMSNIYEKLGLHGILSGEHSLEDYFDDENLLLHYRSVLKGTGVTGGKRPRKAPWMTTMAFHLLTAPQKQEG
jgi:DNA-binding NarL/FixJ family response regulator